MRFGGHETFHIREGWLHKGAKLLLQEPDKLVDEHAALGAELMAGLEGFAKDAAPVDDVTLIVVKVL